ncbi:signal peptidase II [Jannaschia rubra]|uniref:Lipoprotein signal peptidase n=1 Tax=Jannaschia rubra TaxID=282197 RepID=A0A0M6XW40_9RHOB|nr:signal peptidase II [Jannaschia rubra]CTQ34501.1 Lipoprotein signal peptidase [Jannaschia rubra]
MAMRRRNLALGGGALLAALIADRASKALVVAEAARLAGGVPVLPGFDLVFGRNSGVTFGLFGEVPWWGLALVAAAICAWLLRIMVAAPTRSEAVAAGMIVGGALGNVVDRIRFGAVTDFLDFHAGAWHWPAFNLADVAVVCGAALLVLRPLMGRRAA